MITDNWIWRDSRLSHHWIDLLIYTQWEENKTVYFGGRRIELKRGQQVTSTRLLMLRWNTNPKMVLKTLNIFEEENMIICEKTTKMTLITVCNYDRYQVLAGDNPDDPSSYSDGTYNRQRKRKRKQTKEDNKKKNIKEKQIVVDDDMEHQKIDPEFFLTEEKIKQGSEAFSITPEKYIEIVNGIMKEWIFTNEKDWSLDHLRNSIKKVMGNVSTTKSKKKKNEKRTNENEQDNGRGAAGQDAKRNPLERATIRRSEEGADIHG